MDVRNAIKETENWDDCVSLQVRDRVIQNLWMLYKLQSLKFRRPIIPEDAVTTKMILRCCVDAADSAKVVGVWGCFERKDGTLSCQHIIGQSLFTREASTTPKEELEALTIGSNLLWICRNALGDWVGSYELFSDSSISICWVTSENKRLSLFHRNRVVQVRFHTNLDRIYVKSEHNRQSSRHRNSS